MTEDELFDLITHLEGKAAGDEVAEQFEDEARRLPVGEHGRASLLAVAGEHWQMSDEFDEARRCFNEAAQDGGKTTIDVWAHLLSLALDEGDDDEVARMDKQLRIAVSLDAINTETCHFTGDSYASHDRAREALRWFTIPLTWDDEPDPHCLNSRYHLRRDLGLPIDRFDALAPAANS